jgi:rfaE bifunctional protein kinase chain/domain
MSNIGEYLDSFRNKKILIIGDSIIDHYIYGNASGISPDAPVPLVGVYQEEHKIGAIGKVIEYILQMKADVDVFSCIGNDYEGQLIEKKMKDLNLGTKGIINLDSFTPKITRIISREQQMLRLEKKYNLNQNLKKELNEKIIGYLEERIERSDVITILDYDLGFLNPILITQILNLANKYKKKVIVRPEPQKYYLYQTVDLIHINRNLASTATNIQPMNETCLRIIGNEILNKINANGVFIPWVEENSYLFEKDDVTIFPSLLQHKAETYWGIGNATIALSSLMGTTNASMKERIQIAHYAGSLAAIKKIEDPFRLSELKEVTKNGKIPSK